MQPHQLGNDCTNPAVSQSLLEACKYRLFLVALDEDEAVGMKVDLGSAGGGDPVDRGVSAAGHLMERAVGKSASNGRTPRVRKPSPSRLAIFARNSPRAQCTGGGGSHDILAASGV